MLYGAFRFLAVMLSICVIFAGAFLHTLCPIDEIVVSGRVEDASVNSSVRVLPAAAESSFSIRILNIFALKREDSQATLRITTLTLAPEGSHRPHL
jgi:hypothetical protein